MCSLVGRFLIFIKKDCSNNPCIPFDSEDKLESQLEGFEFARQREPVTDGIDVWGQVFELEHAHHGNIAVVILGTRV